MVQDWPTSSQDAARIARERVHDQLHWASNPLQIPSNVSRITQKCIDVALLSSNDDGGINGIGWWQVANAYTAIALHDLHSGTDGNYDYLATALRKCERRQSGFINEFNDDTLWYGLCCVHVYKLRRDVWFLDKAKATWQHMQTGRQGRSCVCRKGEYDCGGVDMEGGCFWKTEVANGYVNAVTTGLYAELSVRLALLGEQTFAKHERRSGLDQLRSIIGISNTRPTAGDYLAAARSSLGWILRCVYLPRAGVVQDGISTKTGKLTDWTFTYNTGVAIGVCGLMFEATQEQEYLDMSCHMARCAMQKPGWVESNGVLTDLGAWGRAPGEPGKNGDGVGFKGVLIRHLTTLLEVCSESGVTNETVALVRKFLEINFDSQERRNTNGNGQYGPWWNGPYVSATSHSQLPVLDVMAAARFLAGR